MRMTVSRRRPRTLSEEPLQHVRCPKTASILPGGGPPSQWHRRDRPKAPQAQPTRFPRPLRRIPRTVVACPFPRKPPEADPGSDAFDRGSLKASGQSRSGGSALGNLRFPAPLPDEAGEGVAERLNDPIVGAVGRRFKTAEAAALELSIEPGPIPRLSLRRPSPSISRCPASLMPTASITVVDRTAP